MLLKSVLISLFIGLALLVSIICVGQRSIVFPRHLLPSVPKVPDVPPATEQIWLQRGQFSVEAWFMVGRGRTPDSPGPVVIFAHGNGEVIDSAAMSLQFYVNRGVSVAALEYRGYGRSGGSPSQDGIVRDGVALYDQIVERADVDARAVIFHGRSLGGGVVCGMARERQPRAMILESTFTSLRARASEMWIPGILVRDPFDNLGVVRELNIPILIMHGVHDEIISVSHGTALADAARDGELHLWPTGHNDLASHLERYQGAVIRFLDRLGALRLH